MKNKILFRVDSNAKIGWGHFYRSLALAQMLQDNFQISFAMATPAPEVKEQLEEYNYTFISLPKQDYSTPDERGDNELEFDLNDHLKGIAIVVLDGYWFGKKYQKELKKHSVKVAIIEDKGEGEYWGDLIINHAPGIQKNNYLIHSKKPHFALGPKFALLRYSFLKAAQEEIEIKRGIKLILICFGGADYYNYTYKITDYVLNETTLNIHVITGPGYQRQDEIKELQERHIDRIIISHSIATEEMIRALQKADIGIVPASSILYETTACRLPTISGTYTSNQFRIYSGLLKENAFIDCGGFEEDNLRDALNQILNVDLFKFQQNQSRIIDGFSSERFRIIFSELADVEILKIRKAGTDDMRLYYQWANDPQVRRNAFNQEPIEWVDHVRWFKNNLSSNECIMLVLETKNYRLGQIRFNFNKEGYWIIDYTVDKLFRGLGIGRKIIENGISWMKQNFSEISIKGEVKHHNFPSLKIFRELNFKEVQNSGISVFSKELKSEIDPRKSITD